MEERPHPGLQPFSLGGKRAGLSFPLEPLIIVVGESGKDGVLADERRTDVVPAQDDHLVKGIMLLEIVGPGDPFCLFLWLRLGFVRLAGYGNQGEDCKKDVPILHQIKVTVSGRDLA